MTEPEPSRLAKLKAVAEYLAFHLARVQQSIAEEEARLAREQPATHWRLQHLPGGDGKHGRGMLHRQGCVFAEGAVDIERADAVAALGEASITMCEVCRPEVGLNAAGRPAS